jgi:UDP-glucose 4-epimerase
MKVLVTGGAGYIGSHVCVELIASGVEVVILDNLCNSSLCVVDRIAQITGKRPELIVGDIRDAEVLKQLFMRYQFEAVMHFAGLKSVGESVTNPLEYYENNVHGSMVLFRAMEIYGVKRLVFSSSATVYGDPELLPIGEDSRLQAINPYGRTKLMIEEVLQDIALADLGWSIAILRYFNPVGAHGSGLVGEAPRGVPNNLMPYIARVATGQQAVLSVFGNDYSTPDGTGIRDYIHVVDLAVGHFKALERLEVSSGIHIYNLGTGHGFSVLEMVSAFEKASGRPVPYAIMPRRAGDVAQSYANPQKAERELGWKATRTIEDMCVDSWRWHSRQLTQPFHNENFIPTLLSET